MIKNTFVSIILFLLAVQAYAVNPDDLLHPDDAFKPTLNKLSDDRIKATWTIADEYYMYRKRFVFESDTPGITLGEAIIPKGKVRDDPGFGRVETYRNQVAIEIPVIRDPSVSSAIQAIALTVKTMSQGCADAGICYPPQRKTLTVQLDALNAADTTVKKTEKSTSLSDALGLSGLINSNQPLPPEEAFQLSLETTDQQRLKASWKVTKGHYLYQSKIKLSVVEPMQGITIGTLDLPPGKDEVDPFFGETTTYNTDFSVSAKIDGRADLLAQAITVKASYQGCSKLTGICYPPQHETLKVNFSQAQLIKVAAINPMAMVKKTSAMMTATDTHEPVASPMIESSDLASQLGISNLDTGLQTLDPDQAFVFDLTASDKQTLNAHWGIVKGHYLYQHKFKFELIDAPSGVSLGEAKLPKGKAENDQYFGDIVTYYDSFDAKIPVLGTENVNTIIVKTSYQGCSKLTGVCYPPQQKTQTVHLTTATASTDSNDSKPASSASTSQTSEQKSSLNVTTNTATNTRPDSKVSEQDGLVDKLTNGNFFNALLIFLLAGLALTFTPCVFPMIPILSGIIAGQGSDNSTRKSFFLSLSYVLAMAATYAIVGVIAALSGENLQVALQNPWVIGAFAILFVLLSLSMFGFYELQMPASIQSKLTNISNSQTGGSMLNAAIMGFLSALIVGPCVTAPLIAALVYIAQTKDVVLGGLSLFALGLGMGIPLLIIGTSAGKVLPKAGAWMDNVKAAFGVMMLALGIWMLERILAFEIIVVLTGILIIFTGIYIGALDALNETSTGWKRFFKATGLILFIYGIALLISAASGNASLLKPLKGFNNSGVAQISSAPQQLTFKQVKGIAGIEDALLTAKQNNQALMLDFYADWCISCKEMEHNTFTDKNVIESLKNTLLIQADVTSNDEMDKALLKKFGLFGPPAIMFFDKTSQENLPYRIVGYKGPKDFNEHIQQFKQTL